MTFFLSIDGSQLEQMIAAIKSLKDSSSFLQRFLISATPVFFGAMLGLGFGFFTEWLRNRRENRKTIRDGRESELAQLNVVMTAIGFNIESLVHTVGQQILPHYRTCEEAMSAVHAVKSGKMTLPLFDEKLHSALTSIMKRCPEPHQIEVDFFRDVQFIVTHDPDLLKLSAWISTFTKDLRYILNERNKMIDTATIGNQEHDFAAVEFYVEIQVTISISEIINSFQLLQQLHSVSQKLVGIITKIYGDMPGRKLQILPPPVFNSLLAELECICRTSNPDWPPPEPPPT